MREKLIVFAIVLACGPGSGSDTSGGSGTTSDSNGTDSASSGSSGTTTTTAGTSISTSATTSGTSDTGEVCDGFMNAYGPVIPVTVTNVSDAPVYLAVDSCNMQVRVTTVDADTQTPIGTLNDCWTCQEGLVGSCVCPGPPCYIAAALRLDPGFSWETSVGATEYYQREYPPECMAPAECGTTCSQATPLPDGDYEVRVVTGTAAVCDGAPCDCTPGPEGWCWIESDGMLQASNDVGETFTLPDPAPVTINVP